MYYLVRLGAGAWAAAMGKGEAGRFPGFLGKLKVAAALAKGGLSATALVPRMLVKRRDVRTFRKLSPREVRKLLLAHRIRLREISEQESERIRRAR